MKVNYVLMYGTPYLKYREFETFEDVSKFLVNKSIVNYSIFKKLEDKEEVEMIYRDNDIRYLEQENKQLKEKIDKAKEYIKENACYGIQEKCCLDDLNYNECDKLLELLGDKENE